MTVFFGKINRFFSVYQSNLIQARNHKKAGQTHNVLDKIYIVVFNYFFIFEKKCLRDLYQVKYTRLMKISKF